MPVDAAGVRLSQLDTDRFGVVTARADELTSGVVQHALDFCTSHDVELLIARCRAEDLDVTRALSAAGGALMDTLVYYERDLSTRPVDARLVERIELLAPADVAQVESIARESFTEYSGHYHADRRLDREACREVYASWARACCGSRSPGGFVLVAGPPEQRHGFACFRLNASAEGELVLGAVHPGVRGGGLYTQLTLAGMARYQASGVTRFVTSTQLTNWPAQAAWVKGGLRPYRAYHTFHVWFEAPR